MSKDTKLQLRMILRQGKVSPRIEQFLTWTVEANINQFTQAAACRIAPVDLRAASNKRFSEDRAGPHVDG